MDKRKRKIQKAWICAPKKQRYMGGQASSWIKSKIGKQVRKPVFGRKQADVIKKRKAIQSEASLEASETLARLTLKDWLELCLHYSASFQKTSEL
jgi:hypothetical protein